MKHVEFPTQDGLTLPGLLFEAKDSKKVAIHLHGNGSSSIFYDVADSLDLPNELNKKGITLLKFNNRGAHIIKKLNVKENGVVVDRKRYGCAYEIIKECVLDIDAAVEYLKTLGYTEFYLIGHSTGANKVCVYNHYKPKNVFKKYILTAGGDDTGIYYSIFGHAIFNKLLDDSAKKVEGGMGEEIIKEILPNEIFSYKAFYDIANPDGDYNCFPFSEVIQNLKLSKKPLFRYFKEIKKQALVIYGQNDEFSWGDIPRVIQILKNVLPTADYKIIPNADHSFTGKKLELGKTIAEWI